MTQPEQNQKTRNRPEEKKTDLPLIHIHFIYLSQYCCSFYHHVYVLVEASDIYLRAIQLIRTDMHQSTQIIIMSIIYVIFLCSTALEKKPECNFDEILTQILFEHFKNIYTFGTRFIWSAKISKTNIFAYRIPVNNPLPLIVPSL